MMESQPELQQSMLSRWADFSILSQEAKAQGIDKEAPIQSKLKDLTSRILVEEFIVRNTGKAEVNDKAIQAYYDSHKAEYAHEEMVKAQHILIKVADANNAEQVAAAKKKIIDIKASLDKGQTFGVLAQKFSDDPGSKANGGDLGFLARAAWCQNLRRQPSAPRKEKSVHLSRPNLAGISSRSPTPKLRVKPLLPRSVMTLRPK